MTAATATPSTPPIPARLADLMLQLGADASLRRRMGAASLRLIEAYSPEEAARNFWLAVGVRPVALAVRMPHPAARAQAARGIEIVGALQIQE